MVFSKCRGRARSGPGGTAPIGAIAGACPTATGALSAERCGPCGSGGSKSAGSQAVPTTSTSRKSWGHPQFPVQRERGINQCADEHRHYGEHPSTGPGGYAACLARVRGQTGQRQRQYSGGEIGDSKAADHCVPQAPSRRREGRSCCTSPASSPRPVPLQLPPQPLRSAHPPVRWPWPASGRGPRPTGRPAFLRRVPLEGGLWAPPRGSGKAFVLQGRWRAPPCRVPVTALAAFTRCVRGWGPCGRCGVLRSPAR
jgi:hypothetical protein